MTMPTEPRKRYRGPVFLDRGFRPFFFGAGVFAALAIPVWVAMLKLGWSIPAYLDGRQWHLHEMLFGYVAAVIAGFLLTAIPNWTGRLPVMGAPLAALFGLWVLGRIAMAVSALAPLPAAIVDAAFLVTLAGVAWREVLAGRNIRNAPVCVMVSLLALANIGFQAMALREQDTAVFERLTLAVVAALITLIGGRIIPSFTRNWMLKEKMTALPAAFGALDKGAMAAAALALLCWIALPDSAATTVLFGAGGLALLVRLARWRGWATVREPLVLILHVGYLWLPVWFLLMALHGLAPDAIDASTAIHALTAGAAGTMTVAVMTRASLGHSGRTLAADRATSAIYLLIVLGATARILAPYAPADYLTAIAAAGLLWCAGFALFAIAYAPILLRGRAPG